MDILTRQAHPGPNAPPYGTIEQKRRDALRRQWDDGIPWPILVDDLIGTVHQTYGGLADPTYLIDVEGRVAYYNMWTHAVTLNDALDKLMAQGGRGVVRGEGVDRVPHLLPAITDGWRALERGLPQSLTDMEKALPGSGVGTWLGYRLRPLLAPFTLRATPVPAPVRIGLAAGAITLFTLWVRQKNSSQER